MELSNKKVFGQIFTPSNIANLLIDSVPIGINNKKIREIIDLGAGSGALIKAARNRFNNAHATLIEIDPYYINFLKEGLEDINSTIIAGNVLEVNIKTIPDIILSNPPYNKLVIDNSLKNKLLCGNDKLLFQGNSIHGDIAFFIKAYSISPKGCSLGLIVSSLLIRSPRYQKFREILVNEFQNLCITQLEPKVFQGTEVQTFLITGVKALFRKRNVILRKASLAGEIVDELEIKYENAINRLDIDYYRSLEKMGLLKYNNNYETIGSVGGVINRGSKSQILFKKLGIQAFHTTDFSLSSNEIILNNPLQGFRTAKKGDILIPRVGSRCLLKQAKVIKGEGVFTDCIYRVSAPNKLGKKIWKTLTSDFGAEWRSAHAIGNCAKYITVGTLLDMPLIS